ncbi:condensation domain-containing protein, partial [Dolichospermum sp. ST_sed3]|nr:condensation domain-containing protein [Dolichospermum sp. ST_sed3]
NELLLTALLLSFERNLGQSAIKIHMEGHGREILPQHNQSGVLNPPEVDLSRTVGWFTSLYPVYLHLDRSKVARTDLGQALKTVKEQLRHIPQHGFSYGIIRYLSPAKDLFEDARGSTPQISFNYLGQVDNTALSTALPEISLASDGKATPQWSFGMAPESTGASHHPRGQREHLLDITASIAASQLRMEWFFSVKMHSQTTIEKLAKDYIEVLQSIIGYCLSPEAVGNLGSAGYTPSDFPDVQLDQDDLDKLMEEIG